MGRRLLALLTLKPYPIAKPAACRNSTVLSRKMTWVCAGKRRNIISASQQKRHVYDFAPRRRIHSPGNPRPCSPAREPHHCPKSGRRVAVVVCSDHGGGPFRSG